MRQRNFFPTFLGLALVAVLLIAISAVPTSAASDGYSYARIVRLSFVSGDVQIIRSDEAKWEPALMNMPIQQGMAVGTNDGRAEIEFENGGAIWLGANSVLQFTELALSNGGRITKLNLSQGTATINPNLAAGDSFLLVTPEMQITPAGRSEFRADVTKDSSSLSVLAGHVSVSSLAGTKDVRKGETLAINANAPTDAKIASNSSPNDWDKWVKSRSSLLTDGQNQSLQYTNAPFSYGMADLSSYGGWSFFPGIGYGWQPFGVTNGWAPFTGGQWSFYPGLGWTWLSSEPWGWVPYHFGQWSYSPVFGWLWLPGGYGYWSPAPVQWVGLGNRIGWTPVNPARLGSVHAAAGVPVVVASKDLGKGGVNKVVTSEQAGEKLQVLSAAPLSNGKIGTPAELAALQSSAAGNSAPAGHHRSLQQGEPQFAVPTAGSLAALHSGAVFDTAQHRFVSVAATQGAAPAQPIALNAAPRPLKMPAGLPPMRTGMPTAGRPGTGGGMIGRAPSSARSTGTGISAGSASHGGSHR
ncbi:MAG: FecR family protein [Candidatus Acidiferrales bacterium]